ncbi:MAG TPA: acyltransferase family protein [Nocardioides sp.]|nr:acyltransferase family protein [Nocardioides sp.]
MASRGIRTDIQALRAIAVSLVVVYHLQPSLVPGGFTGVDVFFAISGFLITAHLIESPPQHLGDLADFWGRRIRRLLPAALLVLGVTLLLVRWVAPQTQWAITATDARSAALYVVNWELAARAVDYLGSDDLPTAVQHYWSLSVEEQFYLVWPLLIGLAVLIGRRSRLRRETVVGIVITAVVVASLLYSMHDTATNPAAAYFVSTTRIWELALGGLLAWLIHNVPAPGGPIVPTLRVLGTLGGLGAIAFTAAAYSSTTPFPGYSAALPVGGALLVILCRPEASGRDVIGRVLALRPIQRLGDISYAVYLWHWPFVVLAPWMLQHDTSWWAKGDVLLVTVTASVLTEKYVERPFRTARVARFRKATFAAAVAGMVVVAAGASYQIHVVDHELKQDRIQLTQAVAAGGTCFGAGALDPGRRCAPVPFKKLVPAPALASEDRSPALDPNNGLNCSAYLPHFTLQTCDFGVPADKAHATIALVGNSHAGQWLPALQVLARRHDWHVRTHVANRCALADIDQVLDTHEETAACRAWTQQVTDLLIHERPDVVVMSNRISVAASGYGLHDSEGAYETGYARVLRRLKAAGLHVLVLHDTPTPHSPIPDCIAAKGSAYSLCSGTPATWIPGDPAVTAVERLHDRNIVLADLNAHICRPSRCYGANGGVISFADGSHMTATYNATLAPYLDPYVQQLLTHTTRGSHE